MKEHFTKDAKILWDNADKKASKMGHKFVGPEHVMLVFFESNNDVAHMVMSEYIGSYEVLHSRVIEMTRNKKYDVTVTEGLLREAQKQANLAFSSNIDVNHLLFAVFESDENIGAQDILRGFGINLNWFLKLIKYPKSIKRDVIQQKMIVETGMAYQRSVNVFSSSSLLNKYGRDLTELAQEHKLDPVTMREKEIDDIIEVLCRRVKSNPLLVGEPGVGKSALLVGLAQRIAEDNVPDKVKKKRIFELNLTSVISGASLQGEFEKRMTGIINLVKNEKNIILFIDEIHTIVGAGGAQGLGDAANILKAPLINGDIKCIGATTISEYRKHIEKDPALARRFQTIEIHEPNIDETVQIIKSIKHLYEEFHKVILNDEIIKKAVDLSVLHIKDQYLPDKAIDLIDQACAKVSLTDCDQSEKTVSIKDITAVLSHKTKIPIEKLTLDRMEKLLKIEDLLSQKIIGQRDAIARVGDIIRLTKSSLDLKPVRPDGVFLFIGPTGVGKTELARVLAEIMFDDEGKMIRLDMSEYMESHSVSKIIGSPPGYIGSDQEGGLTGKVRTEPYSIILLDEVEKAHPDVLNIFLQVFEDGRLTDSQGRTVYFSNCTIIMTSNIGASKAFTRHREIGFNDTSELDSKWSENILKEAVKKHFSPEFINRIDEIVLFRPLDKDSIKKIAELKLGEIKKRFAGESKVIEIHGDVFEHVSNEGYNPEYGARFLNRTIENIVLKPLSRKMLENREIEHFSITLNQNKEILIMEGDLIQ